jgi:drug/metabolite transporter (DMT)-like permease
VTALLFGTVVFAWGFTWFAITQQLGVVPPEVSIFWRFAVAAAVMWLGLLVTGRLHPVPWRRQGWLALLGLTQFALNFLLIYNGSRFVASGVVSVVFSTATVWGAVNQWIFLGRRPGLRAVLGGLLGVGGIALLFGEQLAGLHAGQAAIVGIGLVLSGTMVFSLGNLVSLRATQGGVDLPNAVARGMTWGALFLGVFALVQGHGLPFDFSVRYVGSLLYLAIPGSVIGFTGYLMLVARIGADRAAYASVLFPVLALAVSTVVEGFAWTPGAIAGLPLILLGNVVIFARLPLRLRPATS